MSLEGWSGDDRTHLHCGNMHHDNIGWVALEGFHLEHLQTILFAPPGLPAHLSCPVSAFLNESRVLSAPPSLLLGGENICRYLLVPPFLCNSVKLDLQPDATPAGKMQRSGVPPKQTN